MPPSVDAQYPIMIESEYLALASEAKNVITTSAEPGQKLRFTLKIIAAYHLDCTMLALRDAGGASPIELAQRQLTRNLVVKLVGHSIHCPSRGVDMHVREPKQSLKGTLFNAYRLGFGMWHRVTHVRNPAVLGDQGPVVPAVAQRPEVEPSQPTGTFG